ncbi:hypothetical protein D3C75_702830 [compost metagenome]
MMAERLACMNITEVDLDKRDIHGQQGITQRNARMRKRGRINQNKIDSVFSLMNSVDQLIFRIRLQVAERDI